MLVVTISSDFRVQENKVCHCFHFSPSVRHEVLGPDAMILVFWMSSFKPALSLSSFTLIKKLFSSSLLLSPIGVVWSLYLRLLVFLPEILIPACDSSSPAFHMMYSVYTLNNQGNKYTLDIFLSKFWTSLLFMSGFNCCFLTHIQVSQETGKVVWYSHLFKTFPVCCDPHSQKL